MVCDDMRRIRFTHRRNPGAWGMAYPAQNRIEIDPALDDRTEMDIAIHEGLHVLFPMLDESAIDEAGKSLADLLWRLGYRRGDE